jgi:plastocyanin
MRTRLTIVAASLALLVAAACGGGDDGGSDGAAAEPAESATVVLKNTAYDPEEVAVVTGGTVTWEWDDGNIVHDVKGDDFKSELQKEGTFEHTFDEAGTYEYSCSVHPAMKGEVTVVDE